MTAKMCGDCASFARRRVPVFSLEQIGELLALDAAQDRARARALAEERIAELDRRIADLQAARNWLSELERDCASGNAGPCPILKAFAG